MPSSQTVEAGAVNHATESVTTGAADPASSPSVAEPAASESVFRRFLNRFMPGAFNASPVTAQQDMPTKDSVTAAEAVSNATSETVPATGSQTSASETIPDTATELIKDNDSVLTKAVSDTAAEPIEAVESMTITAETVTDIAAETTKATEYVTS